MNVSRIITASALAICLLASSAPRAHAGAISGRLGVWDFTDDGVRDMLKAAPSLIIAYTFMDQSLMSVEVASGIAYSSVNYRSYHHNFYLVPTTVSYLVNIKGDRLPVVPYFGAGVGYYFKADENSTIHRTYTFSAYGYSFITGFKVPLESGLLLYFDLRYHLIMAHDIDEINLSGINAALGAGYSFEM